jgi:hypothetical protein
MNETCGEKMDIDEALRNVRSKLSKLNANKRGLWTLRDRAAVSALGLYVDKIINEKPFNALWDKYPDKISTNELAEKVVGRREETMKGAIPIDQPCELGYHCPVCKYENLAGGNFDERLQWSEYNGFLWCAVCNKDYPTCFCVPDNIDHAIAVYLECIEDSINRSKKLP